VATRYGSFAPVCGAGPLDAQKEDAYKGGVHLQDELQAEFARRKQRNPRYSLRAFARDLATSHASLSQVLHGRRQVSSRMAGLLGHRAGMSADDISRCCLAQIDRLVLCAIGSNAFRPTSASIAIRTGIPLDAVNCALVRLLQRRVLTMESPRQWRSRV
jgi:hypothetical protein